jgi:iron complex transport system ATP-binding protein
MSLSVKALSVRLGNAEILKGASLSFDLRGGEIVGLLGPNGSGKSTLIRAMCGLINKYEGKISFDSRDSLSLSSKERARIFAYVPQNTVFESSYTVLESAVMGRYPYLRQFEIYGESDYRMARNAIKMVGLLDLEDRIVTSLSGGEAARVAIARALAQDSPVLLLDEPTSALDPMHSRLVMKIIRRLADSGRTVVSAMHDVNLAIDATDRLLCLKEGELIADIKSGEVDERILEDLYDIPWELCRVGGGGRLVAIPAR